MVTVHVLKPFYDLVRRVDREAGEDFDASEERAAYIDAVLPGFISYGAEEAVDLTKMTMQQLTALAKERGIKPKGRQSKASLIALLSEE